MERLTLRDDDGRAIFTPYGLQIYCSTQATADCICKLEEALQAHEPVQPQEKREGDYKNLYCGACGHGVVGYVGHLTGKHFKVSDYCYRCGRAVKWDG